MAGRILVAEDDAAGADLLVSFLEAEGFEVSTAEDGNRALELGTSGEFDLVLLDVHMPLYDGVEVLDMLRRRHRAHPIKVIGLTADVSEDVRSALLRIGVDGFLTKPVDLRELRREIDRVLVTA